MKDRRLDWPGKRITALRERLGMTHTAFAEAIHVTRMTLYNYEEGRRRVRDAYVIAELIKLEGGSL